MAAVRGVVVAARLGAVGLLAVWGRRAALAPFLVIFGVAGFLSFLSRVPLRTLMQGAALMAGVAVGAMVMGRRGGAG